MVYGDIGTSPLYALRECINPPHGLPPTPDNLLGILSLIFWSLTMVVTVKYLVFILRADNQGEGGILALLALVPERLRTSGRGHIGAAALLGIAGGALLYGDGIITPAISVLSAVEGLELATSAMRPLVVPRTMAILIVLFAVQRHGTGGVGRVFGPVMLVWFLVIGLAGLVHVVRAPAVLAALNPMHAVHFFRDNGIHGFRLLGSVVLTVTGGEALYADLGHFGRTPIRRAWTFLVMPALLLCYLGQGALVLARPEAAVQPFFSLAPAGPATLALVGLATLATVIASQALITGAYSLTHQAVQLGFFPRVRVLHTSRHTEGQIYVPFVNWALMIGCLILVAEFRASARLAGAYGIAVSATMAVTSVLFYLVARQTWGWSRARALPLLVLFLAFDLPFLVANLLKLQDGGWVPLLVGAAAFLVMATWRLGRDHLAQFYAQRSRPLRERIQSFGPGGFLRTPGTAVFLASSARGAPPFMLHHVERNRTLHERTIVLTLEIRRVPSVDHAQRVEIEDFGQGVWRVVAGFGFQEQPNVPALLVDPRVAACIGHVDPREVTYYLGRETVLGGAGGRMGRLAERLYSFLSRNATNPAVYFGLPPDQVLEIGTQVDL